MEWEGEKLCKAIKKRALFELFTYYLSKGNTFKAFSSESLLSGTSFLIFLQERLFPGEWLRYGFPMVFSFYTSFT
jgi:hypothetical protein